jgi:hypothetical protein
MRAVRNGVSWRKGMGAGWPFLSVASLLLACGGGVMPAEHAGSSPSGSSGSGATGQTPTGSGPMGSGMTGFGMTGFGAPGSTGGDFNLGSPSTPGGSGASGAGTAPSDFKACTSQSATADGVPLDFYIMLDKSGSMGGNKWAAVKSAMSTFLRSPQLAGAGAGLGLFPAAAGGTTLTPQEECAMKNNCTTSQCLSMCGCNVITCSNGMCSCGGGSTNVSCTPSDYAKPAVDIGTLPGNADPIIKVLDATVPNGGTPGKPALEGGIQHAQSWGASRNRKVAIVFVTDGQPNGCNSSVQSVAQAAAAGVAQGVYTFVMGVGNKLESLNAIAQGGGTKQAYLVENGTVNELIAALNSIQGAAAKLSCAYSIPKPPGGKTLDPALVNVSLKTSASAEPRLIRGVADRSQCGPAGGWYYDSRSAPTQIIMCESTCADLDRLDAGGEVNILFGCKTIIE